MGDFFILFSFCVCLFCLQIKTVQLDRKKVIPKKPRSVKSKAKQVSFSFMFVVLLEDPVKLIRYSISYIDVFVQCFGRFSIFAWFPIWLGFSWIVHECSAWNSLIVLWMWMMAEVELRFQLYEFWILEQWLHVLIIGILNLLCTYFMILFNTNELLELKLLCFTKSVSGFPPPWW